MAGVGQQAQVCLAIAAGEYTGVGRSQHKNRGRRSEEGAKIAVHINDTVSQSISMYINVYQCISMIINDYQCISMIINDYQCISTHFDMIYDMSFF